MDSTPRRKPKHSVKISHPKPKPAKSTPWTFARVCSFLKSNLAAVSVVFCLICAFVMKYYEDVHFAYSNFKKMEDNIYHVLEVTKDAKEAEIKAKYRDLSMKWHPDKNPDCVECEERFLKIKEAYKILMNPHLREMYDKTKGHTVDMIPSKTTTLTLQNYRRLVKNSNKVWVVQVYSDDSTRSRAFAPLWDEFATKFEKFAKFGRVNALLEDKLLKKLPTKLQVYPALILLFPNKRYDDAMADLKSLSRYFAKSYPFYGTFLEDYSKFRVLEGTRLLLYSETKDIPLNLRYLSLKFHRAVRVYFVSNGEHYSRDELLIEDMKSVENMPKPPEKLELYNLLVALFEDKNLKYLSYQLKSNAHHLQQSLYALLSVGRANAQLEHSLRMSPDTYDVLCSRYNIKDRLCLVVPGASRLTFSESHELFHLPYVFGRYENYGTVLNQDNLDADEKVTTVVDLQVLRFNEKSKVLQHLLSSYPKKGKKHPEFMDTAFLLNKSKHQFAVLELRNVTEDLVDDLVSNAADVTWVPLPPRCKANLFSRECLYADYFAVFGKVTEFFKN